MSKSPILALTLLLVTCGISSAGTFTVAPILPDAGIEAFNLAVAREQVGRDLFSTPWGTAIIGRVDVYDRFPYLEARWFQIVSDPGWNRLVYGEVGGELRAFEADLTEPRGLAVDENGRVYVADSGNRRIAVFRSRSEFDRMTLEPFFEIGELARPYDVAFSDRGTPFEPNDDRLYVADTGLNRIVAYDLEESGAMAAFEIGYLGNGRENFAGPIAVAVGRVDGAHADEVYVADSHNGRIVRLVDAGDRFEWAGEIAHDAGTVTSLDTDHWGNVYATSPESGVAKYSADLTRVASLHEGLQRARAFHIPFVNRTDHRSGETQRLGQSAGILVEEWSGDSGIRLLELGVEVIGLEVAIEDDIRANLILTDRANVVTEVIDAVTGRPVLVREWGSTDAGEVELVSELSELSDQLVDGVYVYRVNATSSYDDSPSAQSQTTFEWTGGTAGPQPERARILGNDPNPFRTTTAIRFVIPSGVPAQYDLRVFDVAGRIVRVLGEGPIDSGLHELTWDGRDAAGVEASSGIYFYQLIVDGEASTGKMVILR
jgi:hypothetical protein